MQLARRIGILIGFLALIVLPATQLLGGPQRPDQPPTQVRELEQTERVADMDITLKPPPESLTPKISGEQAADQAWREEWQPGVSQLTATFALFSSPQFGLADDTSVWVVTLDGACVPVLGPPERPRTPGECGSTELNVVIDGQTGEFRFAYSTG